MSNSAFPWTRKDEAQLRNLLELKRLNKGGPRGMTVADLRDHLKDLPGEYTVTYNDINGGDDAILADSIHVDAAEETIKII